MSGSSGYPKGTAGKNGRENGGWHIDVFRVEGSPEGTMSAFQIDSVAHHDMETKGPLDGGLDKKEVVHIHRGVRLSHKKG